MKRVNKYCLHVIFLPLLCLIACNEKSLSPAGYVRWIEDPVHGLRIIRETGGFHFELLYKPLPLIALKEQSSDKINLPAFKQALTELQGLRYFDLRISRKDGEDLVEALKAGKKDMTEVGNYFAGDMQYDFILTAGNDTLPCLLFHSEAAGGATRVKTFLLAFDTLYTHARHDLCLVYTDRILGCGNISFTVKNVNLNRIPAFNPE
ncbi:MAG: hypothetical protein Q8M08_12560 [Bacteroidales bacterium]|nr:hypothetical protein [Bacteroidales bacterium]